MAIVSCPCSVRRPRPSRFAAALLCLVALPAPCRLKPALRFILRSIARSMERWRRSSLPSIRAPSRTKGSTSPSMWRLAARPRSSTGWLRLSRIWRSSTSNPPIKFRDATGTPIKAVFTVFDKPPYAIIARKPRRRRAARPAGQEAWRISHRSDVRGMADFLERRRHRRRQGGCGAPRLAGLSADAGRRRDRRHYRLLVHLVCR